MDVAIRPVVRFEDFLLDQQAGALLRLGPDGTTTRVQLGARAFRMLCLFVSCQGQIVTRPEIMDAVWPDVVVEENNLSVQLASLRRVLDVGRDGGSAIETVTGRGYRFLPPVVPHRIAAVEPVGQSRSDEGDVAVAEPRPRRRLQTKIAWLTAASISVAVAILLVATGLSPPTPPKAVNAEAVVFPAAAQPSVASRNKPRLSVAILPFSGSGGVADGTVDAFVETLTVELAQTSMVVIGHGANLRYRDKPIDIRRIGDDLNAHYAVEGNIRKEGDGRLVIQARLVSTETRGHLWAERFEAAPEGRDGTLDASARQVAIMVSVRAIDNESRRVMRERVGDLDAEDVLILARAVYNLPGSRRKYEQLIALFERVLELEPTSIRGLSGLADALINSIDSTDSGGDDPAAPAKLARAEAVTTQAEALQPDDRMVMLARLLLLNKQRRCAELIPFARRVMTLHPSLSSPYSSLGVCQLRDGDPAAAIKSFEASIRVLPRNPEIDNRHRMIGFAQLFLGQYEDSVAALRQALATNPGADARRRAFSHVGIAAALALAGEVAAARESAAEVTRLWPTITVRGFFLHRPSTPTLERMSERLREGLRLAGIRDHADEGVDHGLASDDLLHADYEGPTPTTVPGARAIRTGDLVDLLRQRQPLLLDTSRDGDSIPGAIGLWGAGVGGSTEDMYQDRLRRVMQTLTEGRSDKPIVAIGWNAERFQGRNLALRLAALGYTEVYWYRGGREAWMAADQPTAPVSPRDW